MKKGVDLGLIYGFIPGDFNLVIYRRKFKLFLTLFTGL